MRKKYIVDLTPEERGRLVELTQKGQQSARKIRRANILLLADAGKKDKEIAELLQASVPTVERTRRKFVEGGLDFALNERRWPGHKPKLDAKGEAVLTTLAQSAPPEGRKRWTLQLLADRLVDLGVVDTISHETVRSVLKKTS